MPAVHNNRIDAMKVHQAIVMDAYMSVSLPEGHRHLIDDIVRCFTINPQEKITTQEDGPTSGNTQIEMGVLSPGGSQS